MCIVRLALPVERNRKELSMDNANFQIQNHQQPQKIMLLVLGMHRSGTSALTGLLHNLGCTLPRTLMRASSNNQAGYFESQAIANFNDSILREIKSHWTDWRRINPGLLLSARENNYVHLAQQMIEDEFGESPLIVLKDPRICRMVPLWEKAAQNSGYKMFPIITFRNPLEVAKSLKTRNDLPQSSAMLLWLRHVVDSESATRGSPRVVTSYTDILERWPRFVMRLQAEAKVEFPKLNHETTSVINAFLNRNLHHHRQSDESVARNKSLSPLVRECYEVISRWAAHQEDKADYKKIDLILKNLNEVGGFRVY